MLDVNYYCCEWIIQQHNCTHILTNMKHLTTSMAFRLVSLSEYENQLTPLHIRTCTEIHTELELPLVNPESFVMALRLSVIQNPVTWVSLSVCVSYVSPLFLLICSPPSDTLSLVPWVSLCLLCVIFSVISSYFSQLDFFSVSYFYSPISFFSIIPLAC